MRKKRLILGLMVFLVVLSSFALAEECGFFCKLGKVLWGEGGEEKALAGKAGGAGRQEPPAPSEEGVWGEAAEVEV